MIMKLGTQTGSLVNHLYSGDATGVPSVGDAATILYWTDRKAGTVIEVITSGSRPVVAVQLDTAVRTDQNGLSESQEYDYSPNPNGSVHYFRLDAARGWRSVRRNEAGRFVLLPSGASLRLGIRDAFYDFSF